VLAIRANCQQIVLSGRVVDEDEAPIGNAHIFLEKQGPPALPVGDRSSDPTGAFQFELPAPGTYLVRVIREGYFELPRQTVEVDTSRDITLVMIPVREVLQNVDVNATPSPVDLDQTNRQERLTGTALNDIPYPSSHSLRNAMRLMPGVIQDPTGAVHFAGAAEYQTLYLLNGFDIGDPVSGRFNSRIGVEGIRSMELWTGRFSPEYGKGSAGALALNTDTGADQFRYTATNFIPGINTNNGLHLGGWTPRAGFSGPLWKGRAWFSDIFDFEYDNSYLNGLPKGQNQRSGWSGSNVLHTQFNLTPSNILFTDFLLNVDRQSNIGLGVLDPVSTTLTQRTNQYFWSAKDQIYLGRGVLVEFGIAQNWFYQRQIPQGTAEYIISPLGRSGNTYLHTEQNSRRDQFLTNAFLPKFQMAGSHQIKVGVDLDRLNYDANFHRTSYAREDLNGNLLARTLFEGTGRFSRPNSEVSSYVLDDWRLRENLRIEIGVRQDWDQLVRDLVLSPRVSASWSPFVSGRTKISGGYAITYDATPLTLFGQPLDQRAVTYFYNPDGTVLSGFEKFFSIPYGHLKQPRYNNWSATIDHRLRERLYIALDFLGRRGNDGFTYLQANPNGLYVLSNDRRDRYHSIQIRVHQTLAQQYEWSASYTRSHTTSNAVLDFNTDQVQQVINNFGPMPWDAPNRFLGWAYLPLPRRNWAIAVLTDARSGFPFSIQDQLGNIVGAVNSKRYPFNFDLNVALERMFHFRGYRFALRGGVINLTGSRNPTAVNNTIGAPKFLQFVGSEGRHFQVRIRFFGRS
jgi:hypothetical protein